MEHAYLTWRLVAALSGTGLFGVAIAHADHVDHRSTAATTRNSGADRFWTEQPVIVPAGPRAERGKTGLGVRNIAPDTFRVFGPNSPDAPVQPPQADGRWQIGPATPDKGGHHWLVASQTLPNGDMLTASTSWNFPSKGDAPTRLLRQSRGGLEIVPVYLPEHGGIREGETWEFIVRFDGRAVNGIAVSMDTEPGTRTKVVTDDRGIARIAIPRDFDPATIDPKAGATRTRKGFALAAEYQVGERRHRTAFNYYYYPDLMRERDLAGGIGFLILGMSLGLPLLRRKDENHA